jgi:hypothetical protein
LLFKTRHGIAATKTWNRGCTQINAVRQAATKEMLKPDLPKRLAALRPSAVPKSFATGKEFSHFY